MVVLVVEWPDRDKVKRFECLDQGHAEWVLSYQTGGWPLYAQKRDGMWEANSDTGFVRFSFDPEPEDSAFNS